MNAIFTTNCYCQKTIYKRQKSIVDWEIPLSAATAMTRFTLRYIAFYCTVDGEIPLTPFIAFTVNGFYSNERM